MARPSWLRGGLPGWRAAVCLIALLGLALTACGPSASPTPAGPGTLASAGETGLSPGTSVGPSESPVPVSAEPSVAPTRAPSPLAGLQANIAVKVTVSALNVREWPRTSAKRNGTLSKGDVLVLLGYGGIKAGGYVWFEAGRLKGAHRSLPALPTWPLEGGAWTDLTGWVAVGTTSEAFVKPLAPRCADNAATNLATLSAMLIGEQLACLGNTPLVLEGTWGCGGCGGAFPGTFKPGWLAEPLSGFLSVNWSEQVGPLQLYFPPAVDRPTEGTILRVHGHLSDARASKCEIAIPTTDAFDAVPVPIRARDAVAYCRQHVVVDSYDVIGTDPSFTPG